MLHEPAASSGPDPASGYKSRIGIQMLALYAAIYAGFVAINVISPKTMGTAIIWGLNLAVVYGMGLIVLALVMAMVYNHLCTRREDALSAKAGQSEKEQ